MTRRQMKNPCPPCPRCRHRSCSGQRSKLKSTHENTDPHIFDIIAGNLQSKVNNAAHVARFIRSQQATKVMKIVCMMPCKEVYLYRTPILRRSGYSQLDQRGLSLTQSPTPGPTNPNSLPRHMPNPKCNRNRESNPNPSPNLHPRPLT